MCGIAGLILNDAYPDSGELIVRMTQLLYHRGPDAGGAVVFGAGGSPAHVRRLGRPGQHVEWGTVRGAVALGARRLAIIDRSESGHQPMSAAGGIVESVHTSGEMVGGGHPTPAWIVFNGEIYNHVELRDELAARGMRFVGRSDTEVALAAYRAWGPACFVKFRGMWAVAIVDWVAGRVVLSRDRLGIKPLYLAGFERGYAFASEIKSLLALPGVRREVNEARLRDFLVEGLIDHTHETLFEDVWALEAGCVLEIDLRPATLTAQLGRMERYWPEFTGPGAQATGAPVSGVASSSDPSLALRALFDDSLRLHLRSDMPVGSCLSGGIDSAGIVTSLYALGARDGPEAHAPGWSQHTFSAVLPGDALDESAHVEAVHAACPGLAGHRVAPDPAGLVGELDRVLWHQEEPFGSPSIWMQWEVMRAAREAGVTVLLDGQGGDELFCGYPGYAPALVADWLARGRLPRAGGEVFSGAWRGHFGRARLAAHALGYLLPSGVRDALRRHRDRRACRHLHPDLLEAEETVLLPYQLRIPRTAGSERDRVWSVNPAARRTERERPGAIFSRFCWELLLRRSLPALLHFEDRSAMAFSIEARVPLLDAPLVEFAMGLPAEAKIGRGLTKRVWRAALRGRVPESILARRDKIGFTAPTERWLAGPLRAWWRDLFASRSFRQRGCFRMEGVERLARRFEGGDARAAGAIWRAAIVEAWARRMLDE